ncbi:MAG: hypothetical protein A2W05_05005 [Candidatus Schekmanbacteria bacterium RBG_16_38_10]|uniref:Methyltransferase domain-containing protein n=1 Tax=Candidatus Schekmanbacteria bacterium RBG_16_38_10 TaxID=1817879 RepID=A0A1F7RPR2_9BACT|nr:MAG: hypothetical protein A2W05_05005 [Candidatus Schekmanbacteria bacterium RBG_16_38_10]
MQTTLPTSKSSTNTIKRVLSTKITLGGGDTQQLDGLNGLIQRLKSLEQYQDIELNGNTISSGTRECKSRWDAIKQHIPQRGVVLDLGSAEGYFSHRIAREFPEVLVLSFEKDTIRTNIQSIIFSMEGLTNVVVCQTEISPLEIARLASVVETIDVIMALSFLHHLPTYQIPTFLTMTAHLTPVYIVEFPSPLEIGVCNYSAVERFEHIEEILKRTYPSVVGIGNFRSHLDNNVQRKMWKAQRQSLTRKNLLPYMSAPIPFVRTHTLDFRDDKGWILDNSKKLKVGVNAWNLLHYNIVYPASEWWQRNSVDSYKKLLEKGHNVTDVRPWNLIITPSGLEVIDSKDVPNEIIALRPDDIEKLAATFGKLKPQFLW